MNLRAVLLLVIIAPCLARQTATADGPFEAARFAPPDATFFLHIDDAAAVRRELAGRPIEAWLDTVLADGAMGVAWKDLAARAAVPAESLFDTLLGKKLTVVSRGGESPLDAEWAITSQVDPVIAKAIEKRLKPRLHPPRFGASVAELPEHALLIARYESTVVVGPRAQPGVFYDVLERVADTAGRRSTLSSDPAVERGRTFGAARAGVVIRHAPPLGGWSVLTLDTNGEQLNLRHAASFDNSPFERRLTQIECDSAPLVPLEKKTLMAVLEPTDVGDGPMESFISSTLGAPLLSVEMKTNLGDRRIITVGEQEGRLLERPVDILSTSVGVCLEVKADDEEALAHLDEHMLHIARRINHLADGAFLVDIPGTASLRAGASRNIDISPATSWFVGGFPVMKNISLTWTVAEGESESWYVIATHPHHLDEVVTCLEADTPESPALVGRFDSVGTAAGRRIGRHLASWADRADLFADPADVEEFRATMQMVAGLAEGVQRCRWRMARPSTNEVDLDVQLILSPPESAQGSTRD